MSFRICVCWLALIGLFNRTAHAERTVVSLNGSWNIAQSIAAYPPAEAEYEAEAPVPGLIDMANPAFQDVGVKSEQRQYFWYKKTFKAPEELPQFAVLKLHKAMYGSAVWLNGAPLGEHLACFTPTYWDLRPHLKAGEENEIVVRVGATREAIPLGFPSGSDFEKELYIPGIYDSADVILCDGPRIVNVQCVPDIYAQRVRVLIEVEAGDVPVPCQAEVQVNEAKSGEKVAFGSVKTVELQPHETQVLDITLPIPECKLWWPENPFLYAVHIQTAGDSFSTRFGMREFHFDPATKRAVLNGEQRYLLGSNICIHRFLEDSERLGRPWDRDWVRKLHQQFKTMNWSILRYCIGFPPELWYEIADEEGMLIQDEFPIWTLGVKHRTFNPDKLEAAHLIPQYRDWMRERWNHPCVVIWDAQNESDIEESGLTLQAVRHLDYSNRPWDNGWGAPQGPCDCTESHPYKFLRNHNKPDLPLFRLSDLPKEDLTPILKKVQKTPDVPVMIDEYDWLWLNRDGTPVDLTRRIYDENLGKDATADARWMFHARGVAALTEFWRAHRKAVGVLHFCGLGYSRPGGKTSDDFVDVDKLIFEPHFQKYVGMAFNSVGIMLDFWEEKLPANSEHTISVYIINDRQKPWKGAVSLKIEGETVICDSVSCEVDPLGQQVVTLQLRTPKTPGHYTLVAELMDGDKRIRSLRDFEAQ